MEQVFRYNEIKIIISFENKCDFLSLHGLRTFSTFIIHYNDLTFTRIYDVGVLSYGVICVTGFKQLVSNRYKTDQ